ncbi:MAG: hypothetical protein J6K20_10710 [Thermoguttaceae bacterium]|nr:hypothetical protein [Thermoguttaceae bacterium]
MTFPGGAQADKIDAIGKVDVIPFSLSPARADFADSTAFTTSKPAKSFNLCAADATNPGGATARLCAADAINPDNLNNRRVGTPDFPLASGRRGVFPVFNDERTLYADVRSTFFNVFIDFNAFRRRVLRFDGSGRRL